MKLKQGRIEIKIAIRENGNKIKNKSTDKSKIRRKTKDKSEDKNKVQ